MAGDPRVLGDGARFLVERRLGVGATAVVYAARDRLTGQPVALKLWRTLDQRGRAQLERELAVMSGLRHSNVVQLHGLFEDEGEWFLAMERVEGVDLLTHVRSDLPPPPAPSRSAFGLEVQPLGASVYRAPTAMGLSRLRALLPQAAAGLHAVHERGLVHRDVRPENLRVAAGGRLVLLDFGISAPEGDGSQGGWVGAPAYMAPEQWGGEAVPESDFYALGVVLFQALTGELPFEGSAQEVVVKKRSVPAPPPSLVVPGVPGDLDALTVALLRADPDARRPGIAALAASG